MTPIFLVWCCTSHLPPVAPLNAGDLRGVTLHSAHPIILPWHYLTIPICLVWFCTSHHPTLVQLNDSHLPGVVLHISFSIFHCFSSPRFWHFLPLFFSLLVFALLIVPEVTLLIDFHLPGVKLTTFIIFEVWHFQVLLGCRFTFFILNTGETLSLIVNRGQILGHNWDKSLKSFPPCIHNPLYSRILPPTPPPPLRKSSLKLVCNVNFVYGNIKLRTLRKWPETSMKLYVHEFGYWAKCTVLHCKENQLYDYICIIYSLCEFSCFVHMTFLKINRRNMPLVLDVEQKGASEIVFKFKNSYLKTFSECIERHLCRFLAANLVYHTTQIYSDNREY